MNSFMFTRDAICSLIQWRTEEKGEGDKQYEGFERTHTLNDKSGYLV